MYDKNRNDDEGQNVGEFPTRDTMLGVPNIRYCEIILFRGVFNYVEFVGKTIHEFKYPQNKILSVRFSNLLVI